MKSKTIFVLLLIASMSCGCIGSPSATYYCSVDDGKLFLTEYFWSADTWHMITDDGSGLNGKYTFQDRGRVLFLDRSDLWGGSLTFNVTDGNLTDQDGDAWLLN